MTIDTDIFDALKGLVGNRVHPFIFPQPPAVPVWPAIRYTMISAVPDASICGDSGDNDTKRYQLDLVTLTKPSVFDLRAQVMPAMAAIGPHVVNEGTTDGGYDEATKTFRLILDYLIHTSP